jgi:hypothetical protein
VFYSSTGGIDIVLNNCKFEDNKGNGLIILISQLNVTDCVFNNNQGGEVGIYLQGLSSAHVRNSVFTNNIADVIFQTTSTGSLSIYSATFVNNKPTNDATGRLISLTGSGVHLVSNIRVSGHYGYESLIFVNGVTMNVTIGQSSFTNNSAMTCSGIQAAASNVLSVTGYTFAAGTCVLGSRLPVRWGPCASICIGDAVTDARLVDVTIRDSIGAGIVSTVAGNVDMRQAQIPFFFFCFCYPVYLSW